MKKLRLPRLISSGMVLQQKKRVRIWGFDEPGRKVVISFWERSTRPLVTGRGTLRLFWKALSREALTS